MTQSGVIICPPIRLSIELSLNVLGTLKRGHRMADKQSTTAFGGCLGSVIGLVVGGGLGGLLAQVFGLTPTGSAFFIALNLLAYFCVGGGAVVGAIVGREVGKAIQRRSQRNG
jgi:hypothetical protein